MATVKDKQAEILETAYEKVYGKASFNVADTLSYCQSTFGDLTSNIALRSAKALHQKPVEIATKITAELQGNPLIDSVEVAGPGFINITLKNEAWRQFANQLTSDFIKSDIGQGKSVNLEFVSANPTGPLVLVNAWAAYFGDVLGNILSSQGYRVASEYYVNNIGLQIENLGKSIQSALGKDFDEQAKENFYPGEYINKVAQLISEEYGNVERVCQADATEVGQKGAETILASFIKPSLASLNVDFDKFFLESTLDNGATLKLLEKAGAIKHYDDATWLDGAKIGLDKDEVLIRSNGIGTYFLSDISYQLDKLQVRGFTQAVAVFGADHHGHAQRLKKVLSFLGFDNLQILTTQIVHLMKDGVEVKMSKRAGNYIEVEELFAQVPSDLARVFFTSHDISTHMSFDLTLATERTKNNPYFYTMYAYARAHSILRTAKENQLTKVEKISHQLSDKEIEILKKIAEIKDIVVKITTNYRVHNLVHAFTELAQAFHEYYESERIIKLEKTVGRSKLALVDKYIEQADMIFHLLGIIPQDTM